MSSSVLEVNPYLQADGSQNDTYVNPPLAGYTPMASKVGKHKGVDKLVSNQITWQFIPQSHQSFLSYAGSFAQRLKNGNTFICANREGHLFEITREGEVVWEYINPLIESGQAVPQISASSKYDNVARCGGKYSPDYPGLQGQPLNPGRTILELYGPNQPSPPSPSFAFTRLSPIISGLIGLFAGFLIRRLR